MKSNVAFLNDPEVKKAALQRASSSQSVGWAVEDTDEQRSECSERFGLSESLLNLFSHGFHIPYGEGAFEKLTTALEAIEPGADTLALVRNWMLGIWETAVKPQVHGTTADLPAAELIRIVKASATEQVPRDVWRRARGAVNALVGETPTLDPVLELLVAMSWDLASSPRATTDIWNDWEATATAPVNRAAGWDQPVQDEVIQAVRDAQISVHEKLGAPPEDPEEAQAFQARALQLANAELEAKGYLKRFEELQTHARQSMIPAMNAWKELANKSVFEACRSAKPAQ